MKNVAEVLLPPWIKLLHRKWLVGDLIAGVILAAIAIPEVMGYASIAKIPVSAGLYTLILPVIVFAAIGASRFLTIGGDAAVAAKAAFCHLLVRTAWRLREERGRDRDPRSRRYSRPEHLERLCVCREERY